MLLCLNLPWRLCGGWSLHWKYVSAMWYPETILSWTFTSVFHTDQAGKGILYLWGVGEVWGSGREKVISGTASFESHCGLGLGKR